MDLNEKELIIDFGSKNYFLISRKNMHNEIIGEFINVSHLFSLLFFFFFPQTIV